MSTTDDFLFDGPVAESTHPSEETYGAYESIHQVNSQPPIYAEFSNGDEVFGGSNGPVLPPPSDMAADEGFALREWRRENAIRLEEKEKKEKEMLSRIIDEAEEYKLEFYRKREVNCEMNKVTNREREKVLFANHEKFHAEADKDYWKAIAELIPKEVPAIEKKRLKKDQEKQPGIVVIQGPKPGKPTDLSRMRQLLINLKHSTPTHLKLSPTAAPAARDAKTGDIAVAVAPVNAATAVGAAPEAVAVTVA